MNMFLTGMMRSGTTLLQQVLNHHANINLAYQSKTNVFFNIIKQFHMELGVKKYHLLTHYSPNNDYPLMELIQWLTNNSKVDCFSSDSNCKLNGVKEVLAEEFLPYFIQHNIKCINIIRDPRDVISSMSFGRGLQHTGLERPVLFDIKNWRKSVLISEILKDSKNLLTLRMEDLLAKPEEVLDCIYNYLDVVPIEFSELLDKVNKSPWKGNSSFGEKRAFDESVIGNYKKVLPLSIVKYIEATCSEEMKLMGYLDRHEQIDSSIINSYKDPFNIKRKEFLSDYSCSIENINYELSRSLLTVSDIIKQEFKGFIDA